MSAVTVVRSVGDDLSSLIPRLAELRVRVFRAWPYLYEGDASYETDYLRIYLRSPKAAVVVARLIDPIAGNRIVGAATCLPLADETANIQAPFLAKGLDVSDFFYFGESVLLPEMRGQGIGVAFFAEREAHARAVSACHTACFCGVIRPDRHPARPPGFLPLDAFWSRRGFSRRSDLTCRMSWTDVGDTTETAKDMVFWLKSLDGSPLP